MAEPLQSLPVSAPRATATVEATMLIEKLGEELLGGGFGGGMGGSPDLPSLASMVRLVIW